MFNVNEHIKRVLLNEYGGSEQKETVILDDNCKYMIKKPDPTRETNRKYILSYINNAYSEYIGCQIARILGLDVQETILGEYSTINRNGEKTDKIVCLCKDVREANERLLQFDTISLSSETKTSVDFNTAMYVLGQIKEKLLLDDNQAASIKKFYYKLFVFDAFIGNTDRHNGNVAILINSNDDFSRIAPIYDCGSCLLPLVDDNEISGLNLNSVALSINSAIRDSEGNLIRYNDYLIEHRDKNIDDALLELVCRINLDTIFQMIDNTDYIPEIRKNFYKEILQIRYDKILIPAIERIFNVNKLVCDTNDLNLYDFYKKNIRPIANLPKYELTSIFWGNNKSYKVYRINKKYALLIDNNKCINILPIHSNNDEIRKAAAILKSMNLDVEKDFINIDNVQESKDEKIDNSNPEK